MERDEDTSQEELVLFFEWKGETVDYGAKDFQELCYAIESFRFVHELEEDVVDRPSDEGSQVQKFAVYSVQSGFQEISLAWILRIK